MRRFAGTVVGALILLHACHVFAAPPERAAEHVQRAWTLYKQGDCGGAQRILTHALTLSPEWDALYFDLGVSAEKCGKDLVAANYYRKYANIDLRQRDWVTAHAVLLEQHAGAVDTGPAAERSSRGFPWWGWGLIGVGAAAIVVVLAVSLSGSDDSDDGGAPSSAFAARF
ncbi:MAG: hypothetical protein RL701_6936 [Pseudomonadota bacterium]|jgi:tetratricopeptide (TPR) repeat protein